MSVLGRPKRRVGGIGLGLVLGLMSARGAAQQQDEFFQEEYFLSGAQLSFDTALGNLDTRTDASATVRFFRSPVRASRDPIPEAAFVERVAHAGVLLGWSMLDTTAAGTDGDGPILGAEGRWADPKSSVTADVEVARSQTDVNTQIVSELSLNLRTGWFLRRPWHRGAWEFGLEGNEFKRKNRTVVGPDFELSHIVLYGRTVLQGTGGFALAGETSAGWGELERLDGLSFDSNNGGVFVRQSLDVHFTRKFSIGGTVSKQFDILQDPLTIEGRVFWNLSTHFGIRGSFQSNDVNDETLLTVSIVGRR